MGPNQYGKAENRVVRIYRDTPRHEIRDVNVSTSLRGDFSDAHLTGDQARILPTDTQKNTCYAYAKEKGLGAIEDYALTLARHFVEDVAPVDGARVEVDEYTWDRIEVGGQPHDHTFVRRGQEVRTTVVTVDGTGDDQRTWVVSGLKDLVVLKSTGSEFRGFLTDRYTTLRETTDRIMSTSLVARWRYRATDVDWDATYAEIRADPAGPLRRGAQPRAATDPVGDGQGGPRTVRRGRRDQAVRAEQAPLPRRPVTVQSWTTPARSSTPTTDRTG